jgi:hypothetical protein
MQFKLLIHREHRRKSANALLAILLITGVSLTLEYLAGWSLEEMLQSCLTFSIVLVAAATRFKTRNGKVERLWITAAWGRIVGVTEGLLERLEHRQESAPEVSRPPESGQRETGPVGGVTG